MRSAVVGVLVLVALTQARLSKHKTALRGMTGPALGLAEMDAVSLAAGPEPMFTEKTMPAVSPTLQCVMGLGLQFFIIYTCLAFVRTCNQFAGNALIGAQKILEAACGTVNSAPMLCVLFLAVRMRAIQLTQGHTEKYKLPQPWVQSAMFACVYCVLAQVILVLIVPVFTCGAEVATDQDGNLDRAKLVSCDLPDTIYGGCVGGFGAMVFNVLRFAIILVLCGGFTTVICGIFTMTGPMSYQGVSPAVMSTIVLTATFFAVQLIVVLTSTAIEVRALSGFHSSPLLTKLEGSLVLARYTVNFAPMLAILFIGTRMRALQMDPDYGHPQRWAQMCFYGCAFSVLVQTVLIIIMPFCAACECKRGAAEGDVVFVMEDPLAPMVLTLIRYFALLVLYGGIAAVIVSIFLITHPRDVSLTPPISPAMQCVMNLTVQYFAIYGLIFVSNTLAQFCKFEVGRVITILEGARVTVMFAPMLSVLFIGARMRALQLTRAKDGTIPTSAGPQPWVQDGMFLSTWSVLVQLIMTILVPICTGTAKPEMDHSGNVKTPEGAHKCAGYAIDAIRYLCLVAMYGGIVAVVVGVFLMTPETLPPYSDQGALMPGAAVPRPPAPPTKAEAREMELKPF